MNLVRRGWHEIGEEGEHGLRVVGGCLCRGVGGLKQAKAGRRAVQGVMRKGRLETMRRRPKTSKASKVITDAPQIPSRAHTHTRKRASPPSRGAGGAFFNVGFSARRVHLSSPLRSCLP